MFHEGTDTVKWNFDIAYRRKAFFPVYENDQIAPRVSERAIGEGFLPQGSNESETLLCDRTGW